MKPKFSRKIIPIKPEIIDDPNIILFTARGSPSMEHLIGFMWGCAFCAVVSFIAIILTFGF